jgi:lysophospholipase L1-like esterase
VRGARGALAAAACVLVSGFLSIPGGAPAGAAAGRLFVDGDSLAVGTRPHIRRELRDWQVTHSVAVGRHTSEGVAVLRSLGAPLPPVIHVSLGTNDDPRRVARFRKAIRTVLDIVGPDRCVVWTNIVRPPVAGVGSAGYNRALARESRSEERLRVVGWARLVRENPHWLRKDGVHATAAGYRERARVVARSVRRCS